MSEGVTVAGAFAVAAGLTAIAVPYGRRLAIATSFYDHPTGYKRHREPTPYLGGAAVLFGFFAAAALLGIGLEDFDALFIGALALAAVGTLDDRVGLGIMPRLLVQLGAGLILWEEGIRWEIFPGDAADLALTVFWTVGLINAFNLMDNLDGAAATVGSVSAAGIGALALMSDHTALAVLALALAGACAGFLPANLSRPSRIFLGDGGSMPIGFLTAAMVMAIPDGNLSWAAVLATAPLAGLPILDTTLVVVSRYHCGAPVLQGGRDHLTHRLLALLHTPRRVALVLAAAQGGFCGVAVALEQLDSPDAAVAATAVYLLAGIRIIAMLESSRLAARGAVSPRSAGEPSA